MKFFLFLISFFLVIGVRAAQMYKVQLDLVINSQPAHASVMTVAANDINTVSFQQNGIKHWVDMTLSEAKNQKNQVEIKITISEEKNKIRKPISSPQIRAEIGKEAQVIVGNEKGAEAIKLRVIAFKEQK